MASTPLPPPNEAVALASIPFEPPVRALRSAWTPRPPPSLALASASTQLPPPTSALMALPAFTDTPTSIARASLAGMARRVQVDASTAKDSLWWLWVMFSSVSIPPNDLPDSRKPKNARAFDRSDRLQLQDVHGKAT
ncbi:hypothetical protein [Rhizobium leguminosarum]|uniref:hypothetical protein n=1 Tax=Rhizobium leguminosarum TaxID=384 RepID=UPI0021BBD20A|nr:hypothetical protein [Rhizobium leguminosarum]